MKSLLRTLAIAAVLTILSTTTQAQYNTSTPGSLETLINLQGLPVIDTSVHDGMFSSTDPQGHGRDHGNFLREENGEYVLAEMQGPGVVTRIWSANAQGTLRIYLDDKTKPAIECMFKDFFENGVPPFQSPITGKSSGGWYSYWPIGYEKYCKIAVTQDPDISRKQEEALKPEKVSVSVKGAKELKLIVSDAGDGYGNDHADWADAKLTRTDGRILYLSDVTEETPDVELVSTKQGWRRLMMDRSVDDHELSINGTKYKKGLGTHSVGETVYKLNGDFEKFEAVAGLDDEVQERHEGTIVCIVHVDGKQVYESKTMGFIKPEGSLNHRSLYYHVNYRTYPQGTKILPFSSNLPDSEKKHLEKALEFWQDHGTNPLSPHKDDQTLKMTLTIKGRKSIEIGEIEGSGFIHTLKMKLASDDPRAYRRTVIKIFWDGEKEPSVWAPYGDFFGSGFGHVAFQALPFGMGVPVVTGLPLRETGFTWTYPDIQDQCHSYWVMPFAEGARIEIENGSTIPVQINTEITWRTTNTPPAGNVGRFCAQWRNETGKKDKLLTLLDVKGAGKFVGCVVSAQGLAEISYLEGNEQYFIDGEEEPSMVGTGTEDFFNGGWYYNQGMFNRPLHGLTEKETTLKGRTSQYRIQIPDAVTFRKEFKLLMEHGSTNIHLDDDFATTTYFYMLPPVDHSYNPPPASDLNFPRTVLVRPNLPGRGAEGDKGMGVIKMRGGRFSEHVFDKAKASCPTTLAFWKDISESYEGTNMAVFMWWPRTYLIRDANQDPRINEPYRGDVIICDGKKLGDYLEIPPASSDTRPGTYICRFWLVKGPDFGKVNIAVAGKLLAENVDLYAEEVMPSEVIDITPVDLPEGPKNVRIELVGKNEKSKGLKFGFYVEKTSFMDTVAAHWKVIGPFDYDSSKPEESFAAKLPPETDLDFEAKYTGKMGAEISWKEMPERMLVDSDYQHIEIHKGIPNAIDAAAFLHTYINAPKNTKAVLHLAHNKPVAVFLNGSEIYRKPLPDRFEPGKQQRIPISLNRGRNSLLIKTANSQHEWLLLLRLTDPEENPLANIEFEQ